MNPPTFISATTTPYGTTGASKNLSITTQAGDVLVVYGATEASVVIDLGTPSGNSVGFSLQQSVVLSNFSGAYIWTGTDNNGGTNWTLSLNATSSGHEWGFTCLVFRGSSGIGGSNSTSSASGAPSLNVTTQANNSALVTLDTDWNAGDGSGRTWRTINGITPTSGNGLETTYYFSSSTYTAYAAYHNDVGAAGSKTTGLSAPSQKYAIVAVEVKGQLIPADTTIAWFVAPAAPALRATATNSANVANSLDITIPATTQAGDFMVLTVAQAHFDTTLFNTITGWTKQGEQRAGAAAFTIAVYTRVAQAGDASSTVTSTSTQTENYTGQIRVYSSVNTASPLDATPVFAQETASVSTTSAPAITVATTSARIITIYGVPTAVGSNYTASSWTDPTGFGNEVVSCTTDANNNAALALYDRITPAAGSQGPYSATIPETRRWAMATLAIRGG